MIGPLALAALSAALPPLVLWWGLRRARVLIGLTLALLLLWLGPWAVSLAVDATLEGMRASWQGGGPHDWSALDQPARKALIDGIRTRLAHGKLIAGLPDIARGLAAAGLVFQLIGWGYRRWQARRQPELL